MGIEDCTNCKNWPNFPKYVSGTTSGLLGNTVMICGGFNDDVFDIYLYSLANECYSFTAQKATLITYMSVERMDAASIVLNDNTLWVTGGRNSGGLLASTEYVTMTGTMLGPDMPMGLSGHAMVAINSTCSMVIGGYSNYGYALTYFYDHNEGEWNTGPSLMQGRFWHAAGIVTDEVTDEHFVAVTGGSNAFDSSGALESTEILQDGEWVLGKINETIYLENLK